MKLFTILLLISSFAFAGQKEFKDRWKECKSASECIAVKGACNECVAIHSRFKKDVELHFRQKAMTVRCDKKPLPKLENVVCFYKKCTCHR